MAATLKQRMRSIAYANKQVSSRASLCIDSISELCHIGHMKTISIRELHTFTGRYIRQASKESLVVTQRGQPVAIVKKVEAVDFEGVPLPNRETWISRLPRTDLDSTQSVSDDRDRT